MYTGSDNDIEIEPGRMEEIDDAELDVAGRTPNLVEWARSKVGRIDAVTQHNSTSSIKLDSHIGRPDFSKLILCVSMVIQCQVLEGAPQTREMHRMFDETYLQAMVDDAGFQEQSSTPREGTEGSNASMPVSRTMQLEIPDDLMSETSDDMLSGGHGDAVMSSSSTSSPQTSFVHSTGGVPPPSAFPPPSLAMGSDHDGRSEDVGPRGKRSMSASSDDGGRVRVRLDAPVFLQPTLKDIVMLIGNLCTMNHISAECGIVALIYLNRLTTASGIQLHPGNYKPLVITSLFLAQKVWQDKHQRSSIFSKNAGLSRKVLHFLESKFIDMIEFDTFINRSTYSKYYYELRALSYEKCNVKLQDLSPVDAQRLEVRSERFGVPAQTAEKKKLKSKCLEDLPDFEFVKPKSRYVIS